MPVCHTVVPHIISITIKARFSYNCIRRYHCHCRHKTCFNDGSNIWKHSNDGSDEHSLRQQSLRQQSRRDSSVSVFCYWEPLKLNFSSDASDKSASQIVMHTANIRQGNFLWRSECCFLYGKSSNHKTVFIKTYNLCQNTFFDDSGEGSDYMETRIQYISSSQETQTLTDILT